MFPDVPAVGCSHAHRKLHRYRQSLMYKNCFKPPSPTPEENTSESWKAWWGLHLSFSFIVLFCFQQSKDHLVCGEGPRGSYAGPDPGQCTPPGTGVSLSTPNLQHLLPPSPSPWRPQSSISQHPFLKITGIIKRRNTHIWVSLSAKLSYS